MRRFRTLALGASMLVLLGACSTGGGSKPAIKIGSDGFDEARVVAEVYAQVLEANGYTVDRAGIGLGTRDVTNAALFSGQIDLKPEYLGSGLAKLAPGKQTSDSETNKTELQAALANQGGGITVLGYTPGQDTNALVVRKETADQHSLAKWSDLTAVAGQLKWGLATDCPTNPVCGVALKTAYGIDIEAIDLTLLDACSTPMADALKAGTIDVGELCSTDPLIITEGWVRLEDDKETQPAENLAPIVRNDYLAKVDKAAFQKLLDDVSAKIDTPTLADLYKQVAVDKKDTKDVASAWLKAQGIIQ
ncbi:MAG TPA: ABC transporter substrate-binding protein [Candidatus Limnocylindrales bacterium]|jgi:osmoprotectant transport system substrate-binding protein|nr:ABC transporter substrate-binding protein [Candidatus Limnocylindrales bacterium]